MIIEHSVMIVDKGRASCSMCSTRNLHTTKYLRSRLEEEFPDADEETQADILEGLSNPPDKLAKGGDQFELYK